LSRWKMKASAVLCVLVGLMSCSSTETEVKEALVEGKDSGKGEEKIASDLNSPKTDNNMKEIDVQVDIVEDAMSEGKNSKGGEGEVASDMDNPSTISDQKESGVQVEIIEESKECSRTIEGVGEKVAYHYRGYFPDTNKDFDSSYKRGSPWRFQMGRGHVIPGVEKGVLGACVGEKRRIIIPPSLAYGASGDGNVIPPNSTIAFDLDIFEIYIKGGYYRRRLEKIVQKEGDCDRKRVHTGDRVVYHYVGYNEHDMSVFDSSYGRSTPYIFKMGERTVISGVDLGMHRACIGERLRLSIPPHLGYEDDGVKRDGAVKIPGGGRILFDITLLEVEDGDSKTLFQWEPPTSLSWESTQKSDDCWTKVDYGNYIAVVYYAWFHRNEWKVFSQSDHKSGYLRYKVGDGSVIKGLDEGVIGTCIGEGRRIVIPPESGFGKTGSIDGTIPPNATVVYDIQVLEVAIDNPWLPPKNVFRAIDSNGDKLLSENELDQYLKNEMVKRGEQFASDESNHMGAVRAIFVREDANLDKMISLDEFTGPKTDEHLEL